MENIISNPIFRSFALSSGILALKMLALGPLTGISRVFKKVLVNAEDARALHVKPTFNNPDIERIRRAHQNDLENIPIFWILGLLFALTNPSLHVAKMCYFGFTAARCLHTVSYLCHIFPTRFLGYLVGTVINSYMGFQVIMSFL